MGGIHAGSPVSIRATWVSPTGRPVSSIGQNWTLLDTLWAVSTPAALFLSVPLGSHPLAAQYPQLDRIGHFLGASTPAALSLSVLLVPHPQAAQYPQLDRIGHFLGGIHAGSPVSIRATWVSPTGRPVSSIGQNWTELDTFGHFLGVSRQDRPSPTDTLVSHPPVTPHTWKQSQNSWQAQLAIAPKEPAHDQIEGTSPRTRYGAESAGPNLHPVAPLESCCFENVSYSSPGYATTRSCSNPPPAPSSELPACPELSGFVRKIEISLPSGCSVFNPPLERPITLATSLSSPTKRGAGALTPQTNVRKCPDLSAKTEKLPLPGTMSGSFLG